MIEPTDSGQQKKAERSEYRSIFKATSIFGGVQVFNIFITIIRGKAVAVLLGTSGMGLNALFLSTLKIITQSTSFGLSQSAVKDIAEANGSGDIDMVRAPNINVTESNIKEKVYSSLPNVHLLIR